MDQKDMFQTAGKYIIFIGIVLVAAGILMYFGGDKIKWLGHLPGDIRIRKENFQFYFPFTSMLLISLLVTLIINIIRRIF